MTFRPLSETKFINDANLVAYWKLEDVNDSKNSYNLTNNNTVAFNPAKFGSGADFGASNTNKNLSYANNAAFNINTFTFSAWIKTSQTTGEGYIFYKGNTTTEPVSVYITSGQLTIEVYKQSAYDDYARYTTSIADGAWHHIVAVRNNNVGVYLYVDGALVATGTHGNRTDTTTETLRIGSRQSDKFLSGILDDSAFFSRALSSAEVNELYQGMTLGEYLPNSSTKLLLHLNGNSTDSSGNGNNGTDTAITYSQANGKFGQGAGFNGSSRINISDSASLDWIGNHTLSCLAKLNSFPSVNDTGQHFVQKGIGDGFGLMLRCQKSSNVVGLEAVAVTSSPSYIMYTARSSMPVAENIWYNVIGVFDNTAKTLKVYINGTLYATTNTGSNIRYLTNYKGIILGAYNNSNVSALNGSLDEVIIENRAWSASEVKKYYTYAKGRFGII